MDTSKPLCLFIIEVFKCAERTGIALCCSFLPPKNCLFLISWNPIPDSFSDIYNNLYLSEVLALGDDTRAQLYRQRGVAAFLAKSTGLSEMQRNVFMQQWLARGVQTQSSAQIIQQGNQGRTV